MKFEYVGFKPVISQHGVSFKSGKDDKYIYLPYAYEILEAISYDYGANKNHSFSAKIDNSNVDKLFNKVSLVYPNLEDDINKRLEEFKAFLDSEQDEILNNTQLNEVDKNTYISNLNLMKDYQLKRAKNKIFYYYGVYTIAKVIKDKKLKEIELPFNEKFWHVLKTLQGVLSREKINSDIKVEYKDTNLRLKITTSL